MDLEGIYAEKQKTTISKGYILYDTIYTTFWKWENYKNGEQIIGQGCRDYKGVEGWCNSSLSC